MPYLVIMDGALKGKRFALTAETTRIGRVSGNDVVLDAPSISSGHAVITREADGFRLRDIESTNGTRVNGHRVTDAILFRDDEIILGDLSTVFTGEDAPVRPAPVQPVSAEVTEPIVLPTRPPIVVASAADGRIPATCPPDFRKRRDVRLIWAGVIALLLVLIGFFAVKYFRSNF
jgi:predicted component of type VI protein secretion system